MSDNTGNASFSIKNLEDRCDNCNIVATNGVIYKAKASEKKLTLCHECLIGMVRAIYHAGLLE